MSYASASGEVLVDEVPVDERPKSLQVLGPCVAIIDVVRVFPNINGKQWGNAAVCQRCCGVAGVDDSDAAVHIFHKPGPAGAEVPQRSIGERLLEFGIGAKGCVNGFRDGAGCFTTAVRLQALPVEAVVPDLGGIVKHATGQFVPPCAERVGGVDCICCAQYSMVVFDKCFCALLSGALA